MVFWVFMKFDIFPFMLLNLRHEQRIISERIVEKIKEIIDPSDTPSSQKNDTVNVALNIRVPTHVNQRLDDIIADTKKAMHNYHLTELEYRNIGDDMEL